MLLLFTKAPAASVGPSRPSVPADNKEYSICYKGKTIKYSNENYFQLLNQVFNNIDNIFEYEISRNKKWYDDKDGHNNYEINKGIFKKLSKYILELN